MEGIIKVGKSTFQIGVLQDMTLTQSYERYSYLRKDVVKMAHSLANPKRKTKKKSPKKA